MHIYDGLVLSRHAGCRMVLRQDANFHVFRAFRGKKNSHALHSKSHPKYVTLWLWLCDLHYTSTYFPSKTRDFPWLKNPTCRMASGIKSVRSLRRRSDVIREILRFRMAPHIYKRRKIRVIREIRGTFPYVLHRMITSIPAGDSNTRFSVLFTACRSDRFRGFPLRGVPDGPLRHQEISMISVLSVVK